MRNKPNTMRPNKPAYVSEFDEFINGFLADHPEVEEDRRRGWYIWWDHRLDLDEVDKLSKDEVAVKRPPDA